MSAGCPSPLNLFSYPIGASFISAGSLDCADSCCSPPTARRLPPAAGSGSGSGSGSCSSPGPPSDRFSHLARRLALITTCDVHRPPTGRTEPFVGQTKPAGDQTKPAGDQTQRPSSITPRGSDWLTLAWPGPGAGNERTGCECRVADGLSTPGGVYLTPVPIVQTLHHWPRDVLHRSEGLAL